MSTLTRFPCPDRRNQIMGAAQPIALTMAALCLYALPVRAQLPQTPPAAPEQQAGGRATSASATEPEPIDPNQPIKPGFLVNVTVDGESEPSGNYLVDQAGNIAVHLGGVMTPVMVKGLTPAQAEQAMLPFLKKYLVQPSVKISIVQVPHAEVQVSGAVRAAGSVVIQSTTTLVDVLSRADWTDIADLSDVRITRTSEDHGKPKRSTFRVHFDRYIKAEPGKAADETQNPTLQDKDQIFVAYRSLPGNGVFSVAGEVNKPQQNIPLRTNPPMTIREAINLAGGTIQDANRTAVTIRRPTERNPLIVDLDRADQGDPVNNVEIHADDAIWVEKIAVDKYIDVSGGVEKPGKFLYERPISLTQAVLGEAGGPKPGAKVANGVIYRHPNADAGVMQPIKFNWKAISSGKAKDLMLQPGDSVYIPDSTPSNGQSGIAGWAQMIAPLGYLMYFLK